MDSAEVDRPADAPRRASLGEIPNKSPTKTGYVKEFAILTG